VVIPAAMRHQLIEHASAEAPNEACGLLAFRDGVAERYLPGDNELASPYRFRLKPRDPSDFFLEDEGYEVAVFHSHPTNSAVPSRTDLANIGLWEGRPYFILALPTGELRGWRIEDGRADELEVAE
jgi:[CysO sulfur-carrier protein]-S-L-cysteine hydrolase